MGSRLEYQPVTVGEVTRKFSFIVASLLGGLFGERSGLKYRAIFFIASVWRFQTLQPLSLTVCTSHSLKSSRVVTSGWCRRVAGVFVSIYKQVVGRAAQPLSL